MSLTYVEAYQSMVVIKDMMQRDGVLKPVYLPQINAMIKCLENLASAELIVSKSDHYTRDTTNE